MHVQQVMTNTFLAVHHRVACVGKGARRMQLWWLLLGGEARAAAPAGCAHAQKVPVYCCSGVCCPSALQLRWQGAFSHPVCCRFQAAAACRWRPPAPEEQNNSQFSVLPANLVMPCLPVNPRPCEDSTLCSRNTHTPQGHCLTGLPTGLPVTP